MLTEQTFELSKSNFEQIYYFGTSFIVNIKSTIIIAYLIYYHKYGLSIYAYKYKYCAYKRFQINFSAIYYWFSDFGSESGLIRKIIGISSTKLYYPRII